MARSVLIVRLGALGDLVHALPAVAALRDAWPEARIDWLSTRGIVGCWTLCRSSNRVIVLAESRHVIGRRGAIASARAVRRGDRSAGPDQVGRAGAIVRRERGRGFRDTASSRTRGQPVLHETRRSMKQAGTSSRRTFGLLRVLGIAPGVLVIPAGRARPWRRRCRARGARRRSARSICLAQPWCRLAEQAVAAGPIRKGCAASAGAAGMAIGRALGAGRTRSGRRGRRRVQRRGAHRSADRIGRRAGPRPGGRAVCRRRHRAASAGGRPRHAGDRPVRAHQSRAQRALVAGGRDPVAIRTVRVSS